MTRSKTLPAATCAVPKKLDWKHNASTGTDIANIGPSTRLIRWGSGLFYRAEYWGNYSFDFPIGSNASTPAKALRDLCKDVRKLRSKR